MAQSDPGGRPPPKVSVRPRLRARRVRGRVSSPTSRAGRATAWCPGAQVLEQPGPPRRVGGRGGDRRRGRDPAAGPAPLPGCGGAEDRRCAARAGRYATGVAFLPPTPTIAEQGPGPVRGQLAEEEDSRPRLARGARRRRHHLGRTARRSAAADRAGLPGAAEPARARRRPPRPRSPGLRRRASAPSTPSTASTSASLSARTLVYKGMLTAHQLDEFFPDLSDERLESGLALVHSRFSHQHLPELAARPPLPVHGPQRRDQHRGRQPQLDARPRGAARDRHHRRATWRASSRSAPRAPATRPPSTRCSSCCTSAGARSPTPCS